MRLFFCTSEREIIVQGNFLPTQGAAFGVYANLYAASGHFTEDFSFPG